MSVEALFNKVKLAVTGATAIFAQKASVAEAKARLKAIKLAMGGYKLKAQELQDKYKNNVVTASRYADEFKHELSINDAKKEALIVDNTIDHETVIKQFEQLTERKFQLIEYIKHAEKIVEESKTYVFGSDVEFTDLNVGWRQSQNDIYINDLNKSYAKLVRLMSEFADYVDVFLSDVESPADESKEADKK